MICLDHEDSKSPLKLNPTFGMYSRRVGGADADLISGNRIVDVKVSRLPCVERFMVRQLVGYLMLHRSARRRNRRLPEITSVAIYFARFAHLWSLSVESILRHPKYRETEKWLSAGATRFDRRAQRETKYK
jgi:hypothetical protein